ncbi:MAG TPA: hypothetical protein V6C69_10695 [Trichormus sp.]|jgi:hypothetical protein
MWKNLTTEQERLLAAYVDQWQARVAAQPPPDRQQVWSSTKDLYTALGLKEPKLFLCEGPWQLVAMAILLQLTFIAEERVGGKDFMQWMGERLTQPMWAQCWQRLLEQFGKNFSAKVKIVDGQSVIDGTHGWAGFGTRLAAGSSLGIWDRLVLKTDSQFYRATDTSLYGYIRGKLFGATRTSWIGENEGDIDTPARSVAQQLTAQLHALTLLSRQRTDLRQARIFRRRNDGKDQEPLSIISAPAPGMFEHQLMEQLGSDGIAYFEVKLESLWRLLSSSVDSTIWAGGAPESLLARFISSAASSFISMILWQGGQERWLPFYSFPLDAVGERFYDPDTVRLLRSWTALLGNSIPFMPFSNVCFVSDQPIRIELDDRGRLHSADFKAIEYPDGFHLYSWHGTTVADFIIVEPEKISVELIESEQNVEVRRVLIERYGTAKYVHDSGSKEIDRDSFGVLYRKEIPNDEAIVMVAVMNSTPEPDGSFHQYFLRVPPTINTAREAVAWTFSMDADDYFPKSQT